MLNRVTRLTLAALGCAYCSLMSANALASSDIAVSTANSWRFVEDPEYAYAKGSSSKLLSLKEAVLHHALMIKINKNMIDSYTFKVGCILQNPTPLFEIKVNSLDIRLFDSVNDFVFARFIVDNNQSTHCVVSSLVETVLSWSYHQDPRTFIKRPVLTDA